jgi:hypothetical protein
MWIANRPVNMVTELDFDDYMPSTDDRPSLILRKAGDDTLWEVAKKYGSSVAKILDVNNLQGEPDADRMLIIPIQ